jgi:hypothetical protein
VFGGRPSVVRGRSERRVRVVYAYTRARKYASGVYTPTRRVDGSAVTRIRVYAYSRIRPCPRAFERLPWIRVEDFATGMTFIFFISYLLSFIRALRGYNRAKPSIPGPFRRPRTRLGIL